jgi:hypothetical protein
MLLACPSSRYFGTEGDSNKAKPLSKARKEKIAGHVDMSGVDKLDIKAPPPAHALSDSEIFTKVRAVKLLCVLYVRCFLEVFSRCTCS